MDIKQRLQEVIDHQGEFIYDMEQAVSLARDALAEINALEDALLKKMGQRFVDAWHKASADEPSVHGRIKRSPPPAD